MEALQTLKHTNQRLRITGVIPEDLLKKQLKRNKKNQKLEKLRDKTLMKL